jgi:tetratricopeptide (TPR) repeat protein
MQQADVERRRRYHEMALRYYSRALELDRGIVAAWIGQVQMLVQLGECSEADLWGRKALEILPGNAELFAGRAQALCRTGDQKQAQELSDGALAREGSSAYRWLVRGEIMLARRQKTEEHCFRKAVQTDGDGLGRSRSVWRAATTMLRLAVQNAPDQLYPWYVTGLCQLDLENNDAARRTFERCLSIEPTNEDLRRQLADLSDRSFSPGRWLRGLWRRRS